MLYVHAIGYELRAFFRHSPQQSFPAFVDERDIVKVDNAGPLVSAAPSSPGCSQLADPGSDQAPLHDPPSFCWRLRDGDLQHICLSSANVEKAKRMPELGLLRQQCKLVDLSR